MSPRSLLLLPPLVLVLELLLPHPAAIPATATAATTAVTNLILVPLNMLGFLSLCVFALPGGTYPLPHYTS
jgi:hypothetical protein